MLEATARDQASAGRLERAWTGAREAEWAEFRAECARYLAELDKEVATGKLTAAEFEGDRIEVSELLSAPDRHGLQTHAKGYGPLARHDHRRTAPGPSGTGRWITRRRRAGCNDRCTCGRGRGLKRCHGAPSRLA